MKKGNLVFQSFFSAKHKFFHVGIVKVNKIKESRGVPKTPANI